MSKHSPYSHSHSPASPNVDITKFKAARIQGMLVCANDDQTDLQHMINALDVGMSVSETIGLRQVHGHAAKIIDTKLQRKIEEVRAAQTIKDVDKITWR